MECFGTTDLDNNSRLITLSAIIISGLHCINANVTVPYTSKSYDVSSPFTISKQFFSGLSATKTYKGKISIFSAFVITTLPKSRSGNGVLNWPLCITRWFYGESAHHCSSMWICRKMDLEIIASIPTVRSPLFFECSTAVPNRSLP